MAACARPCAAATVPMVEGGPGSESLPLDPGELQAYEELGHRASWAACQRSTRDAGRLRSARQPPGRLPTPCRGADPNRGPRPLSGALLGSLAVCLFGRLGAATP